MIPILVTKINAETLQVLTPYNQPIGCPTEYTMYSKDQEGLIGNMYIIEGSFKDTITLTLRNKDEYTFQI